MWELDHKEGWVPRNWCLQTVVLEKTLENPLDKEIKAVNRKGNQSWIFRKGWCWLKVQYFGHLMWRANSLEKTLMLEKIEGRRRRGRQRMRWLDGITDSTGMSLSRLGDVMEDRTAWHAAVHGSQRVRHDWAPEQQKTHTIRCFCLILKYCISYLYM